MKTLKTKSPKVTLVGAGPGDPELLTLKAVKAIRSADVILYDALSNDTILDYAPLAEKIFVGKRKGTHYLSQEQINELIVSKAFKSGHVVRLKGGDPFVFGRGKEEQQYIESFGIETEVIPGISSSIAVPASIGIPVTSRGVSESFWVITGTTSAGELSNDIALAAQSTATVVILMGLGKIAEITKIYRDLGREELAIAVIQNGTLETQQEIVGTISNIEELIRKNGIGAPAILVIGDVVHLASKKIREGLDFNLEDEFIFQNLNTIPFVN
ncbi:uroporphyrinogen-III C-methyltransferase [Algoriphagus vanfongensis]|uniref:uroporphyrinogen-III C-methyltransferase n=1 Tax=Algoriphagus vanfongensis TaxID=426371 RepID=UPI00041EED84|nr:uroporphyrinogen-III C-methyltransferase [Algoriphagus vanfongensis]